MWLHLPILLFAGLFGGLVWWLLPLPGDVASWSWTELSVMGASVLLMLFVLVGLRFLGFGLYAATVSLGLAFIFPWLSLLIDQERIWSGFIIAGSAVLYLFLLATHRLRLRTGDRTGAVLQEIALWSIGFFAGLSWLGWYINYNTSFSFAWTLGVFGAAMIFFPELRRANALHPWYFALWLLGVMPLLWLILLLPFPSLSNTGFLLLGLFGWQNILRYSLLHTKRFISFATTLFFIVCFGVLLLTSIPWFFVR